MSDNFRNFVTKLWYEPKRIKRHFKHGSHEPKQGVGRPKFVIKACWLFVNVIVSLGVSLGFLCFIFSWILLANPRNKQAFKDNYINKKFRFFDIYSKYPKLSISKPGMVKLFGSGTIFRLNKFETGQIY